MRKMVEDREIGSRIHVDSAGTINYHEGASPDSRMSRAAALRGYQLTGRARGLTPEDFSRFDLIVAMDRENYASIGASARDVRGSAPAEIVLLSHYLRGDWPLDVPDPYYGGWRGFERVLDMVEAACPAILESLIQNDRITPQGP